MGDTIAAYSTPAVVVPSPDGLAFPANGEGLNFGPNGLTFPPVLPTDPGALFPAYIPSCEQLVWDELNDATQTCLVFPEDDDGTVGIVLPATFTAPPDIGLFVGSTTSRPITIVKGWPAFPGEIPAIGVAVTSENEDAAQRLGQGGFAGDATATDDFGNVIATCAYYAEPLYTSVVIELIHENRDERDRLHDQIRRKLYPLRHRAPSSSSLIKELQVQNEKSELPVDEQPLTLYVSLFTVEMWFEALIPTEVVAGAGILGPISVTVDAGQETKATHHLHTKPLETDPLLETEATLETSGGEAGEEPLETDPARMTDPGLLTKG